MPLPLAPPPIRTPFTDKSESGIAYPWVRFFQEAQARINYAILPVPGPYASDALAAQAGVQVGQQYYQTSGAVVVRLT